MNIWTRFHDWRFGRLVRRVVYASADAMLRLAAEQLQRELTSTEKYNLQARYATWLMEDESRLLGITDERPLRVINLFLQDAL